MFTPFVDLHTHTQRSDGRLAPKELIAKAYEAGIRIMSITDHNYTEDLTELREFAASQFNEEMTLIQGAEVSALYEDGIELHIVALGFNPEDPDMKAMLERHRPDRRPYIDQILAKLRENKIDIGTYDDIVKRFPNTKYIGRMALARCLFEEGYTNSVDQSFDLYLGAHGERRAYVKNPLKYSSLEEVVRTIIQAGGIPILAHLLYYDFDNGNRTGGEDKERLVQNFSELVKKNAGIGGIEVYYTRYKNMAERLYLLQMAQKYGLLISGGSDYHEQESWETLEHRTSCSACSDLLDHLGIKVDHPIQPTQLSVVSGFSGVGKGTVCHVIEESRAINGKRSKIIRSVTNRPPRSENENYTFITQDKFEELVSRHQLLEYNAEYASCGYGTPVSEVSAAIEEDRAIILEIDRTGLMHLLTDGKISPRLVRSVFIVADAPEVEQRLRMRGTETASKIKSRLSTAVEESYYLDLYDAVIVNDSVEACADTVVAVLEGRASECNFDSVKFRSDMEHVLSAY